MMLAYSKSGEMSSTQFLLFVLLVFAAAVTSANLPGCGVSFPHYPQSPTMPQPRPLSPGFPRHHNDPTMLGRAYREMWLLYKHVAAPLFHMMH